MDTWKPPTGLEDDLEALLAMIEPEPADGPRSPSEDAIDMALRAFTEFDDL